MYIQFLILIIIILLLCKLYNNNTVYEQFTNDILVPIDIVYTWVDGSDLKWNKTKNKYINIFSINKDSNINNRFNDNNELKYSLRSIYKYANWINNIYIVVADGQKPKWLNTNHNKIHLINHSDIIDKKYLPTFNSHVIEHNIYKIPNLTENFLYFNDDFFLGNYIKPNDIMYNNRIGYYFYDNRKTCKQFGNTINNEIGFKSAWKNNNKLIKLLDKKLININCPWHQGVLCKKSIFVELNNKYSKIIYEVLNNKFRSVNDIAPIGLSLYYGLFKNKYKINRNLNSIYIEFNKSNTFINKLNKINHNKPHFFCINDLGSNTKNMLLLNNFFKYKFPNKSPYEL